MGKDEKIVGTVSYNARVFNSFRIGRYIQAEKRLISKI